MAPLLKAGLIEPRGIIIDSKSGVSGAGRQPKLTTHYAECNESISAYNVGRHRHTPEIEQVLTTASGEDVEIIFTPHLVPMDRGILTTAYSVPRSQVSEEKLFDAFREFYQDEPFVRVVDHLPATKDTTGTNFVDVTVRLVPRPRDHDQLRGQPGQGRLGCRRAELQPDVRLSGNPRAALDWWAERKLNRQPAPVAATFTSKTASGHP